MVLVINHRYIECHLQSQTGEKFEVLNFCYCLSNYFIVGVLQWNGTSRNQDLASCVLILINYGRQRDQFYNPNLYSVCVNKQEHTGTPRISLSLKVIVFLYIHTLTSLPSGSDPLDVVLFLERVRICRSVVNSFRAVHDLLKSPLPVFSSTINSYLLRSILSGLDSMCCRFTLFACQENGVICSCKMWKQECRRKNTFNTNNWQSSNVSEKGK